MSKVFNFHLLSLGISLLLNLLGCASHVEHSAWSMTWTKTPCGLALMGRQRRKNPLKSVDRWNYLDLVLVTMLKDRKLLISWAMCSRVGYASELRVNVKKWFLRQISGSRNTSGSLISLVGCFSCMLQVVSYIYFKFWCFEVVSFLKCFVSGVQYFNKIPSIDRSCPTRRWSSLWRTLERSMWSYLPMFLTSKMMGLLSSAVTRRFALRWMPQKKPSARRQGKSE